MRLIDLFRQLRRAVLPPRQRIAHGEPPRPRPKPKPPPNRETRDGDTKARPLPYCKITGRHLGRILCKALGESPRNVQRIELVADASEAAIVKITRFASDSEAGILGAHMREFNLIEAKADEPE